MRKLTSGIWAVTVTSAVVAIALGAARPPVEAAKPNAPVEASKPDAQPNSGGPNGPEREDGVPAPAAEPTPQNHGRPDESPTVPKAERKFGGIWRKGNGEEQPRSLLQSLIGKPKGSEIKEKEPVPTPPIVTRPADPLDLRVDEAIGVTARRVLSVDTHTPWQIGHGMLAFRRDYVLRKGNAKVNAFEWVAENPTFKSRTTDANGKAIVQDLPWFYLTRWGARPQKFTGTPYEFEGHPNQFLAFFALARLPLDFEFQVQGRKVTYGDMLHNAKMEINDREEVTWDLWTFAYYLDSDESWRNANGDPWSMERLVSTVLSQYSPTKSPCGGCHALFALASARNAFVQTKGSRLTGVWTRTQMHLDQHIALAQRQQNRDGSFSSNYFKGPGYSSDPSKRISTSGHTLEFLMMALPQSRLKEQWVRNGVAAVARDLVQYQQEPLEVGGMYHAVHALVLYRERTRVEFASRPQEIKPVSAEVSKEAALKE